MVCSTVNGILAYVLSYILSLCNIISLFTILGPSLMSTCKGLTLIRLLSCGFNNSVGSALHWHHGGGGFESRSELEIFSGLCSSCVMAALAVMTVITQLRLMDKINLSPLLCINFFIQRKSVLTKSNKSGQRMAICKQNSRTSQNSLWQLLVNSDGVMTKVAHGQVMM